MATRLTRTEQVERNRELVLGAARRIFLERGYTGATLEAIAEAAGFSKGVVYSQFGGKPDLFLALLKRRSTERAAENAAIAAAHAGLEGLRELLRTNLRRTEQGRDWAHVLMEFRVAATRDPELNRRYAELHNHTMERFAEAVQDVLARGGLATVHPPRLFAELIFSLDAGHVLEQAAGTAQAAPADLDLLVTRLVEPL
ncbi:TetR/AcrR family transcriptional regulator [Pseudonocardia hispaniensis]|uniref:TetR/AcrR family transcriptional regulator n=1 Tax=Pseudonocardia hispaniensis TaxID=904933 RepID=A0ABW1J7Z3_9PSEU